MYRIIFRHSLNEPTISATHSIKKKWYSKTKTSIDFLINQVYLQKLESGHTDRRIKVIKTLQLR